MSRCCNDQKVNRQAALRDRTTNYRFITNIKSNYNTKGAPWILTGCPFGLDMANDRGGDKTPLHAYIIGPKVKVNYIRAVGNFRRFSRRRCLVGAAASLGLFSMIVVAAGETSVGTGFSAPLFSGFSPPLESKISESYEESDVESVADAVHTSTSLSSSSLSSDDGDGDEHS